MSDGCPYPIVEVTWIDSHRLGGWDDAEATIRDVREHSPTCFTCGYLIHKDRHIVSVALSRAEAGNLCDTMTIPAIAIKRIRYIEGKRK